MLQSEKCLKLFDNNKMDLYNININKHWTLKVFMAIIIITYFTFTIY